VIAVLILALGLSAPTTFFSILVGAIRPLPVPDGQRIVRLDVTRPDEAGPVRVRLEDVRALGAMESLDAMGAFRVGGGTLLGGGGAARVSIAHLTAAVPGLLRVEPRIGRWPGAAEAKTALVIGDDVWADSWARDPGVLGQVVTLDGSPRTVVGVMPPGFGFPFRQNAWTLIDERDTSPEPVEMVGRLAEGVGLTEATAELNTRWRRAGTLDGVDRTADRAAVAPFTGGRGEAGEAVAFLGLVIIGLCLLLIASANVANLLLVRATERSRALGIQAALGAGSGQIASQLLLEAFVIALAGGTLGLLLAGATVDALQRSLAAQHFGYFWMRLAIDGRVATFVGVLVVGASLASGVLPVVRVLRQDVQDVLREGAGGSFTADPGWGRWFVTVQLGLSCAALVGAGLAGRALSGARDFSGNVPASEILVAEFVPAPAEPVAGADRLVERIAAAVEPAVVAAALGAPGFREPWSPLEIGGVRYDRPEDRERVSWNGVTERYFEATGLELREGRLFDTRDAGGAVPVAVVNEAFVRRHLFEGNVLGRRIRVGDGPAEAWREVVGVVSDEAIGKGDRVRHDRAYVPLGQAGRSAGMLIIREGGGVKISAADLRREIADFDPSLALESLQSLTSAHAYLTRVPRAMGALALGGGVAGFLVAAVGLYGLLAFRVRQRGRELGVRLALGASGARLAGETLFFALRQLVPAIAVGLTIAWLAAPVLGVLLLGLDARSVSTFAGVAAAFLTVGLAAAGIPAWRAARTEPADVLRSG
jgi:predicted permease